MITDELACCYCPAHRFRSRGELAAHEAEHARADRTRPPVRTAHTMPTLPATTPILLRLDKTARALDVEIGWFFADIPQRNHRRRNNNHR